jgi:alginate O-acetyltransferase complex protein AlgI
MLFPSFEFLFLFLPITLFGYYLLTRKDTSKSILWLVTCSLFFYLWWNPPYLLLLMLSIIANFYFGKMLKSFKSSKLILALAVVFNLGLLGYFKYFNFFIENTNFLFSTSFNFQRIVLPLAISFYTFQQIAYVVDVYKGFPAEERFLYYTLFVTFFPQLIAGPIVHHKETIPQFFKVKPFPNLYRNLAVGITYFSIGMAKKILIADNLTRFVNHPFHAADLGLARGLGDHFGLYLSDLF